MPRSANWTRSAGARELLTNVDVEGGCAPPIPTAAICRPTVASFCNGSMGIWESLSLRDEALSLRAAAAKPREQIDRIQQSRLAKLVEHARTYSPYYREKFAALADAAYNLADLPTTTKTELMDNFDHVVTVADVSRSEVEAFF